MLAAKLPAVDVRITLWGQFVGASPSDRDATLLRSQLEPWPTPALRRRLVHDFCQQPAEVEDMPKPEVMQRLLAYYAAEGTARRVVKVDGIPVGTRVLDVLLAEMRAWSARHRRNNRPS